MENKSTTTSTSTRRRRTSSILPKDGRISSGNFSTKFSLPTFVKRVSKLTNNQRNAITRMGFGNLLQVPNKMLRRNLLVELMERWNCEKCAFVLLPGEIQITLKDVAVILGIRVTGEPVILQEDGKFLDLEREYGAALWNRKISISSIEHHLDSLGEADDENFIRSFLLFTFGTILFPNSNGKVDSRYLSFLLDLDKVNTFAWGQAVLEDLTYWLCRRKEGNAQYIGGCLIFLQIWSYEHIDLARPSLLSIVTFPRVCRWGNIKSSEREKFSMQFQELKINQILWELELTSEESKMDIIQDMIERQAEKGENYIQDSFVTNVSIDNVGNIIQLEVEQGVVDLESGSDMELVDVVHRAQEDSFKQLRRSQIEPMASLDTATFPQTSYSREQEEQTKHPWETKITSATFVISDDKDDLETIKQVLEKPICTLEKEISDLKMENEFLRKQLLSSFKLEDQNAELRKEVENLRKENEQLRLSSSDLVDRMLSLCMADTAGEQMAENEGFGLRS